MWGSKKSNSWPSILVCILLITPLILIVSDFGPSKSKLSSFGLNSFDFFNSFLLNSPRQDLVSNNVSDHVVLNDSLEQKTVSILLEY